MLPEKDSMKKVMRQTNLQELWIGCRIVSSCACFE